MDEKPGATQGNYGPGPGPGPYQYPYPYPYPYPQPYPYPPPFFFYPFPPFVFRIPPRFFVGFMPRRRRYGMSSQEMHSDLCVRCISEAEFSSMVRMGFMEVEVVAE